MSRRGFDQSLMPVIQRVISMLLWSILAAQLFMVMCIPMMHMMNDSGWYYMNVHFLQTGEYQHESMYPSFHAPSQYYPLLGYSGFLWLCHSIADLFGIPPIFLIKLFQLILYAASSVMLVKLGQLLSGSKILAYIPGILYLLYYPNLVFANLLMSEALASFLLIGSLYGYYQYAQHPNIMTCMLICFLLGYMMLVKTVFLPVAVIIFILMCYKVIFFQRGHWFALLFFFLMPVSQIMMNQKLFHNTNLQKGLGWHLWDRVIATDKLIAASSAAFDSLRTTLAVTHQKPDTGYWWGVTRQLSELGYSEDQCQELTLRIALDGIREHPLKYAVNTFRESYFTVIYPNEAFVVSDLRSLHEQLDLFCHEPQHQPFCEQVNRQAFYDSFALTPMMMRANAWWANGYNKIAIAFHHPVWLIAFLLSWLFSLYHAVRDRSMLSHGLWLVGFVAATVIIGSIMAEYPQSRLIQPAMPMIWLLPLITIWRRFAKRTNFP